MRAGVVLAAGALVLGCGDDSAPAGSTATGATAPATSTPRATAAPDAAAGDITVLPRGTQLRAAAVGRDGRLLVAGLQGGISTPRLLLERLGRDGQPDRTFGDAGRARMPGSVIAHAVAVQRDGRIVVAGEELGTSGAAGMVIARFTAAGALDRRFGRNGVTRVLAGDDRRAAAHALALRPDGGILVGGTATAGGAVDTVPVVARLTSAGRVADRAVLATSGPGSVDGLAVTPDGHVLIAGSAQRGQFTLGLLGRLTPSLALDRGFGGGVQVRQYARGGAAASALRAVTVLPGGRAVATGYALEGGGGPGGSLLVVGVSTTGRQDVRRTAAARDNAVATATPPGGAAIAVGRRRVHVLGSWDEAGSSAIATQTLRRDGGGGGRLRVTPFRAYAQPLYGTAVALGRRVLHLVGTAGATPAQSDRTTGVVVRLTTTDSPIPGPEVR